MVSEWQEPALEAVREDLFRLLDGLREAGRSPGPGGTLGVDSGALQRGRRERLELVRLLLIQALRLLEGNVAIPKIPVEAWRHPIPEMSLPEGLSTLLNAASEEDAEGCAIGRRLLLGPEIHRLMGGEEAWEPSIEQVIGWLRRLRDGKSGLLPWALVAVRLDHRAPSILCQLDLDQLLAAQQWSHPSQVFLRPRPPLKPLLEACAARLEKAQGEERQSLLEVQEKLERAIRIEEVASRRRRNRRSRGRD